MSLPAPVSFRARAFLRMLQPQHSPRPSSCLMRRRFRIVSRGRKSPAARTRARGGVQDKTRSKLDHWFTIHDPIICPALWGARASATMATVMRALRPAQQLRGVARRHATAPAIAPVVNTGIAVNTTSATGHVPTIDAPFEGSFNVEGACLPFPWAPRPAFLPFSLVFRRLRFRI